MRNYRLGAGPRHTAWADTKWVEWQQRPEVLEWAADPANPAWGSEVGAGVAWTARSRWSWTV